jgi:hypothetical protein
VSICCACRNDFPSVLAHAESFMAERGEEFIWGEGAADESEGDPIFC